MFLQESLLFYRNTWNITASQADLAGQPPSSFLFLPQDEPSGVLSGVLRLLMQRLGQELGLVAQLVRARA
jgi:hypothetical protein